MPRKATRALMEAHIARYILQANREGDPLRSSPSPKKEGTRFTALATHQSGRHVRLMLAGETFSTEPLQVQSVARQVTLRREFETNYHGRAMRD